MLGILDISVESILVGIMCSVLVLPVNLLWIFLFRYSRVSSPQFCRVNRQITLNASEHDLRSRMDNLK